EQFYIEEGEQVNQGDALVKIKNSRSLTTGVELSVALSKELGQQISSLEKEYKILNDIHKKELKSIDRQIQQLQISLSAINNAKRTSFKKLKLKENQLLNNQTLHQKGYLSLHNFESIREEYLTTLEAHERLEMDRISVQSEITALESKRLALPGQLILQQANIERQVSELKSQVTQLDNQYEFIKKAPEAGFVTTIQPSLGTRIESGTPLMSIIPLDSPLEIELLLPTHSAGFVQMGDKVKIRFDAFPYQKFGFISGEISNVDQALILPTDKVLPVSISEAMYRVRAKLYQQSVSAYGKKFPLKVGMIADADIILEKRSLLEWLLDPIYAVKGRLG
ncbi:HlyD family secretion protein, partial [Photobacterium sp. OFAV2-7]|uniref:HlyD family secretion protein n=1 Tax=Photobacterium sp. OFAV2-7 TaxID=2917748 RepID=UPI001EF40C57